MPAAAEIYLFDCVYPGDAAGLIQQIRSAGSSPISLHINSPGGAVFDGYAIYNALLAHPAGVTVYIDGLAASIASFIAMAGRKIIMAENAMLMLHNPACCVEGNADDMRRQGDLLDKVTASLVNAYSRRTSLSAEQVSAMMDAETWLTADMAKELGFIDEIAAPLKMAAHFDISKFKHPPPQLMNTNLTLEAKLENALADADAATKLVALRDTAVADLQGKLSAAGEETARIQALFDAASADVASAKADVARLTNELSSAHGQINTLTTDLASTKTLNANLEALCGVKGIDPKAAIKVPAQGGNATSDAELYDQFKAAGPIETARMMNDPALARRIKAESARRLV